MGGNIVGGLLLFAVILVVIFLVFREFFCWYWKINQNVALLTEIRDLLTAKDNLQGGETLVAQQSPSVGGLNPAEAMTLARKVSGVAPAAQQTRFCTGCGGAVVDTGSAFCTQCGAKL